MRARKPTFTYNLTQLLGEETGLPNELAAKIRDQTPTLFAQTSVYWHSYYSLKQLKEAAYTQYHQGQEQLLTNFLIHNALLTKEECETLLPSWISYLTHFCQHKNTLITNRILANALLLILDKNCTERQQAEFEFLLKTYCFSTSIQKHQLYFSILNIIAHAKNKIGNQIELNIADLINPECNFIASVCEAQLILAPFESIYKSGNVFPLLRNVPYPLAHHYYNYVYLLHAWVKLTPARDFWQDWQTEITKLTDSLPGFLCAYEEYDFVHIDLLATLIQGSPPGKNPWDESLDDMTQRTLTFIRYQQKAAAFCSLNSDKERIEWIEKIFCLTSFEESLLPFAARVCEKLSSDSGRVFVINHLIKFLANNSDHRVKKHKIAELIKLLTFKIQSEEIKTHIVKKLYQFTLNDLSPHAEFLFLFSSPPSELALYHFCDDPLRICNLKLVDPDLFQSVYPAFNTPEQINMWIKQLQPVIDSLTDINNPSNRKTTRIIVCYTYLLSKSSDSERIQLWQQKLQHAYTSTEDYQWLTSVIKMILPCINCQNTLSIWMNALLLNLRKPSASLKLFFNHLLECIRIVFTNLSPDTRADYSKQLQLILFTQPLKLDNASSLSALADLLHELPDEIIPQASSVLSKPANR